MSKEPQKSINFFKSVPIIPIIGTNVPIMLSRLTGTPLYYFIQIWADFEVFMYGEEIWADFEVFMCGNEIWADFKVFTCGD